jgi:TonB family protein
MASGFRGCYNRGLACDSNMTGLVRVTVKVGASGEVLSAIATSSSGLSTQVIDCTVARVQAAKFSPPPAGEATIVIPVSFAPAPETN